MPTVPRYDNLQAGVAAEPAARFTMPNGPGAGEIVGRQAQQVGDALGQAATGVSKLLLDAQATANEVRVTDVLNQAVQMRTDAQLAALKLRGRDALERPDGKSLPQEAGDALQQKLDALRDGLGNDAQKLAFSQASGKLLAQFREAVGAHVVREFETHSDDVAKASIATAQNQAALLWGDPAMRQQSTAAIQATIEKLAQRKGWDHVQRDAALTEAMSPMHLGVIKGMLDSGRAGDASDYVKANTATMTLQARATAQDMTRIGAARQQAQQALDGMAARGLSTADMLAEARQKFSGEARDELEQRIEHRASVNNVLQVQAAKKVSTDAWSQVMAGGRIQADTLADLRRLAPEEERQIRDWQEAKARRAKADAEGKATTDMDVYYGLRRLAADDPAAFAQLDLRKSQPYLKDGDLKHLIELQGGISKNDARAMQSQRVVKATLSAINADIRAAGIDLTPKEGTAAATETAKFMGALTMALDAATADKKAPLTEDEARRIGLSMVRQGIEQGSGIFGIGSTTRRGYQIATDETLAGRTFIAKRYGDIPASVRDALVAERYPKGVPLSPYGGRLIDEAAIERAYTKGLEMGRFR